MLGEAATWKECSVGEVDLQSDPHASQESVAAVLGFLVADASSENNTLWGVVENLGFLCFECDTCNQVSSTQTILAVHKMCTMNKAARNSNAVFHHDT